MKKIITILSTLLIVSCVSNKSYKSLKEDFNIKDLDVQVTVKNDSIGGNPRINEFLSRKEVLNIVQTGLRKKLISKSNLKKANVEVKISLDYHRCFVIFTSKFCGVYIKNINISGYQNNKLIFSDYDKRKYVLQRNTAESIKYIIDIYSGNHTKKDEGKYVVSLEKFLYDRIQDLKLKSKNNSLYKVKY